MCEKDDVIIRIDLEASSSDDEEKAHVLTYTTVEPSLTEDKPSECMKV